MIFLPIINKLFANSATPKAQKAAKEKFSTIPYISFQKSFQTFHEDIYNIEDNIPINDSDIDLFSDAYEVMGSIVHTHLENKELTKIDSHALLMGAHGCVSFLEYTHTIVEKGDENWATLMICDVTPDEDNDIFSPHVEISGIYSQTNNGYMFTPKEALCLNNYKENSGYIYALDDEMLAGMINYANQALIQIMGGEHPNIIENQKWISPRKLAHAELNLRKLCNRNLNDLLNDTKVYQASKTPEKTYETGPVI